LFAGFTRGAGSDLSPVSRGFFAHAEGTVMDLAEVLIFDLGWIFFAAWGMVLAAVGAIAFGRDLFPPFPQRGREPERRSV
jgi:hypothetical protein